MGSTGYRRLTREELEARQYKIEDGRTVARAEMFAAAREAAKALKLATTTRYVLQELVAVWGQQELGDSLVVWPSNNYLMDTTGRSERSLRYAFQDLIKLGLVAPKRSANGKRYSVRSEQGNVVDAFGFDLTPLYARRGEFQNILLVQKQTRSSLRRSFDLITVCRRAITDALHALSESFPAHRRDDLEQELAELKTRTPRRSVNADLAQVKTVAELWKDLRFRAEDRFWNAGKDGNSCRHIETNNEDYKNIDQVVIEDDHAAPVEHKIEVSLVLDACPAHKDYIDTPIRNEVELVAAGEFIRILLHAHPSAWTEAKELLGPVGAAAVAFMTLQRQADDPETLKKPGGYFRGLARNVATRRIDLTGELMERRRRRLTRGGSAT